MGEKSRQKRLARANAQPSNPARDSSSVSARGALRGKRRWVARILAAVLVPALLLGAVEVALRLTGYGAPTDFFAKSADGKALTTNWKFGWQFYPRKTATSPTPLTFAAEKAPGTLRIFIIGESAAAGTPDPAFGFSRMLEVMLADQYPDHRFEVLNVAMRGIDSHIIRHIARECSKLSPDLFLVYMGNNEAIGRHSAGPDEFQLSSSVRWIRFKHAVKRMRLAQAGESILARVFKPSSPEAQDMAMFRRQRLAFDHPRREAIHRNFGLNLGDICRYAAGADAPAIVCTVGVNLRDFPPLGSLHRPGLPADDERRWQQFVAGGIAAESRGDFKAALDSFENAARMDDHFAELLYRMARCHERTGSFEQARRHYGLARDWDALQFRSDSRLNNVIRSVATNGGPGVRLVDLEQRLAESRLADSGVPGGRIFQEHVHFRFDGDHLVAEMLLPEIAAALKLSPPGGPALSRDACAARLAYTPVDDMNVKESVANLLRGAPFLDQLEHGARQAALEREVQQLRASMGPPDFQNAKSMYAQAIAARPDDWMLRLNYANLLIQFGQHATAVPEYAQVVQRFPSHRTFRVNYGATLLQAGRAYEAVEQFSAALKIDPQDAVARQGLAAATRGMRR